MTRKKLTYKTVAALILLGQRAEILRNDGKSPSVIVLELGEPATQLRGAKRALELHQAGKILPEEMGKTLVTVGRRLNKEQAEKTEATDRTTNPVRDILQSTDLVILITELKLILTNIARIEGKMDKLIGELI